MLEEYFPYDGRGFFVVEYVFVLSYGECCVGEWLCVEGVFLED